MVEIEKLGFIQILGILPNTELNTKFLVVKNRETIVDNLTKALINEGSYSSPFFLLTANTNFMMIACSFTGVISSISLFSSQHSRNSLKNL